MKKEKIIIGILIGTMIAGTVGLIACSHKKPGGEAGQKEEKQVIDHYTCPMHPFVHEEKPGSCPICQMKLVPVYKESSPPAPSPAPMQERGMPPKAEGVRISLERQQLIGVTTGPVEKKIVKKEIRTAGQVAFDPELAIAQREFVEIAKNVPSLKPAATQRLKLLGMSDLEIDKLAKKGRPQTNLYLPEEGESLWVYAPLYEYEIPYVKVGDQATLTGVSLIKELEGTVRAIDRVIDPMTRSARARIEVPNAGGKVKPQGFLNTSIQVDLGEQLTVPKPAVIDTGSRQIVFVVHDGKNFEAREVKLGPEAGDDRVILEGVKEGEIVATSAAFLIDSESQLKAAVAGMKPIPSCPAGQIWDQGMSMCMSK